MKKKVTGVMGMLAAALIFGLVLMGCASTIIVDETLPPEQTATVRFYDITVLQYNGKPIEKRDVVVKIPEGKAEFLATLHAQSTYFYYSLPNVQFSYSFEGGKKYTLHGASIMTLFK